MLHDKTPELVILLNLSPIKYSNALQIYTMLKKYQLLLLLFVLSNDSYSQYFASQSDTLIEIVRQKITLLSLPLTKPFLTASIIDQKTHGKLGSFKKGKKKLFSETNGIKEIKKENGDSSIAISGYLTGKNIQVPFLIEFTEVEQGMKFKVSIKDENVNNLNFSFFNENEEIFGMGEQFSHFNFKGKKVPMLVEENGIGRGDKTVTWIANLFGAGGNEMASYAPIPFFLTTGNKAFFLNNTELSEFDFSQSDLIRIEVATNEILGYIWQSESPKKLLQLYTSVSGRMPVLPEFTKGAILGLQGGKEKVERIIRETISHGTPVTAIWIQDWVGKRKTIIGSRLQWDWMVNESYYPDFKNWTDSLKKQGISVLGYINPYMVEGGKTCETALKLQYIVHDKKGKPYKFKAGGFNAYMLDFTNPGAREWYKNIIVHQMIGTGLSGWMADFGEWLPFDAKLHSGAPAAEYHNQYAVEWMKLNREAIEESGAKDIFVFNRSGFGHSNQYSIAFWTGDQMANFGLHDGLPSAICALNSSGISGIAINHSDIGGYTAINLWPFRFLRNKEILFRWMEMEAFTPLFRTHEGLIPERMSQFYTDEETQVFFSKMANINLSLYPLFKKYNEEATETGVPIIRHPYIEFPLDTNTYHLKYQFMIGDSLMVIPVITAGSDSVYGYLPEGEWEHFFTREIFKGERFYNFHAPIGQALVLRRKRL
jgi:sulfoquinovosidase